jgi:3'-phosphoadenosine 5'-phosphosulfate (PAPS) 3'-phosphatase
MMVANGEVDAMVYCENWTHKWDSCAGDAVIKSMGGRFTTPWGYNIRYGNDRDNTHNKQGMLVSLNREAYEQCMDVLNGF